jgi:cation diffusion facilitator family transporter
LKKSKKTFDPSTLSNISLQWGALILSIFLFMIKILAYWFTQSNAILADGMEGLVNVLGAGFGLIALYYAKLPFDRNHPYGHGKIEFVSAGFEGVLVLAAGLAMISKAVYNIIYPIDVEIGALGISLVAFAGAINFLLGMVLVRRGKASNSVQLVSSGKHLIADTYTSIGVVIGLILIYLTGLEVLDNIIAIIFGVIVTATGWRIVRESFGGILDETDDKIIEDVVDIINKGRQRDWIDLHNLRIVRYGNSIHIDVHMTLPFYWELSQVHDHADKLEELIDKNYISTTDLSVHVEPCSKASCSICQIHECTHRMEHFKRKLNWSKYYLVGTEAHKLKT